MKYHVIMADPPWSYEDKKQSKTVRNNFGASKHYDCLSLNDIKALNIDKIAEDNAVLFLWTTMPLLPQAFDTINAWNFKYKTIGFTWIKMNKNGKPFFGVGAYCKVMQNFV